MALPDVRGRLGVAAGVPLVLALPSAWRVGQREGTRFVVGAVVTPTAPIDATHAESLLAIDAIRREVRRLRAAVAAWELGE